jgi:hypothetical protein
MRPDDCSEIDRGLRFCSNGETDPIKKQIKLLKVPYFTGLDVIQFGKQHLVLLKDFMSSLV